MKRITVIFLVFSLVLLCSCKNEQKQSAVVTNKEASDITVYVTKTGKCYHTSECTSLNKSKIEKTLSFAAEKYRPCQLCYPPVISEE